MHSGSMSGAGGWSSPEMWIWPVVGGLAVVLLVLLIIKVSKK